MKLLLLGWGTKKNIYPGASLKLSQEDGWHQSQEKRVCWGNTGHASIIPAWVCDRFATLPPWAPTPYPSGNQTPVTAGGECTHTTWESAQSRNYPSPGPCP